MYMTWLIWTYLFFLQDGNVVYQKRQNIYYVKLQEKLSTLDSGQDYVMTVTSISGRDKTKSDKVTIHHKNYDPKADDGKFFLQNTDDIMNFHHVRLTPDSFPIKSCNFWRYRWFTE